MERSIMDLTDAELYELSVVLHDRCTSPDWYRTKKNVNAVNRVIKKVIECGQQRPDNTCISPLMISEEDYES